MICGYYITTVGLYIDIYNIIVIEFEHTLINNVNGKTTCQGEKTGCGCGSGFLHFPIPFTIVLKSSKCYDDQYPPRDVSACSTSINYKNGMSKNQIDSFSSDDDMQPFHGEEKDIRNYNDCENSGMYTIINEGSENGKPKAVDEFGFSYTVKRKNANTVST